MAVALGLVVDRTGCVAVALALADAVPELVASARMPLAEPDDLLAQSPYGTAFAMPRGAGGKAGIAAAEAVREGRLRQVRMASQGLAALQASLTGRNRCPDRAVLVVNRAGWITDLLDYSLAYPEHAAVADGLARRDAVRAACGGIGLPLTERDDKTLDDRLVITPGLDGSAITAALREWGRTAGQPWRREHKRASLAAWSALVEPG